MACFPPPAESDEERLGDQETSLVWDRGSSGEEGIHGLTA
jgi:hypothetical protein